MKALRFGSRTVSQRPKNRLWGVGPLREDLHGAVLPRSDDPGSRLRVWVEAVLVFNKRGTGILLSTSCALQS